MIASYEVLIEIARQGGVGIMVPYNNMVAVTPVEPILSLYYHPDRGVRAAYLTQEMVKVHKRLDKMAEDAHFLENDD